MDFLKIVAEYQKGETEVLLKIISKFNPIINKYNRLFLYDDISSELIIAIIEALKKLKLEKIKSSGQLVVYISTVIKNKYIDLVHANQTPDFEVLTNNIIASMSLTCEIKNLDSKLNVNDLIKSLTKEQKWVIEEMFLFEKTESKLAKNKNVTKQAINNMKKRAFKKLKQGIEQ